MPPSYNEATRSALRQVIERSVFDLETRPYDPAFCGDYQQSRSVLSQFETRIGTHKWLTKAGDPRISPHLDAAIARTLLRDIKLDDAKDKVKLDDGSVWHYSRGTLYDIALPDIGLIKHGRSSQRMASGQLQPDNRFRKEVSLRQTATWKEN
ncbi:hypothetical protein HII31_02748 [Pseudocercospora fuligena]|uniref:Uncharacterized protein n=1 Tax=Pseudocercospora fuligena TaxID=685502 RepID=A0A8H6VKJ5_9PEZI|nr:hypothetical protein HII31_02748 [Pseudocercospora fuligena]